MVEKVTIKYNGVLHEIPINELDMVPDSATDQDVLTAIAAHLGIPALTEFELDRFDSVWQARPEAVHGIVASIKRGLRDLKNRDFVPYIRRTPKATRTSQ